MKLKKTNLKTLPKWNKNSNQKIIYQIWKEKNHKEDEIVKKINLKIYLKQNK